MSDIDTERELKTRLTDSTFLRLTDNSQLGITIIRRGYLKYFNAKFEEIFGYTKEEIHNWKKFEFFKFIHPEDIPNLLKNIRIEDSQNVTVQFRGVKKNGDIIPIENYIYRIKYNNKYAYFSTYVQLKKPLDEKVTSIVVETKKNQYILLDYNLDVVKILEDNNLKYKIIKQYSYREED
ncbi:MAG: PAS domain-containing protein [Candidatus Hermodarchaeota archaeon]